jgi:hypothetical protein
MLVSMLGTALTPSEAFVFSPVHSCELSPELAF